MPKPKKNPKAPVPQKALVPQLNTTTNEWVVQIMRGLYRVFDTKEAAERYCLKQSVKRPQTRSYHQELPHSSVWTGAPWDHTFKHLR